MFAPGVNIVGLSLFNHVTTKKNGTSMAAAFVSGIMAHFLGYEGGDLYHDASKTYARLRANMLQDVLTNIPQNPSDIRTKNLFVNTGINNPNRRSIDPYDGIPKDEVVRGTCKISVHESWACPHGNDPDLFGEFTITNADGTQVYQTQQSTSNLGLPLGSVPQKLRAKGMGRDLYITAEKPDRLYFNYGDISWSAYTVEHNASCLLNGNEWSTSGPKNCPSPAIVSR